MLKYTAYICFLYMFLLSTLKPYKIIKVFYAYKRPKT